MGINIWTLKVVEELPERDITQSCDERNYWAGERQLATFQVLVLELMLFKYFHHWPWETEYEYANAIYQCHVFLFYQVMATFQLQHKKKAIWVSFCYMISCCCESTLAFGPLCHCPTQVPSHVKRDQNTNLTIPSREAGEYFREAAQSLS